MGLITQYISQEIERERGIPKCCVQGDTYLQDKEKGQEMITLNGFRCFVCVRVSIYGRDGDGGIGMDICFEDGKKLMHIRYDK